MQTVTIAQIDERLRQLPADKLAVVLDFVSYLADRQPGPEALPGPADGEADLAEAGFSDYLADLEDYEERLARGEIKW